MEQLEITDPLSLLLRLLLSHLYSAVERGLLELIS